MVFVVDASCHCKFSVLGSCSHAGALLVATMSCLLNIEEDTACTSNSVSGIWEKLVKIRAK